MTPSTEDVRFIWIVSQTGCTARAEFDRWLAEHDAEVREQAAQEIEAEAFRYAPYTSSVARRRRGRSLGSNPGGALTWGHETYTLDTRNRNDTLGGDAKMFDLCEGDTVHLVDRWGHPYTGKVRYELSIRGYGTNLLVGPYLVRSYSGQHGAQVREIVSVTPHR